jgi:hypothetical protein
MVNPLDQYKMFIDGFVAIRPCVTSRWVREDREWPDLPTNQPINEFLSALTPAQKEVLASLLQEARDGGIHDALSYLTDEIHRSGLRIVIDGVELPVEPFDSEMYYDWVCRREGDDWPDRGTVR